MISKDASSLQRFYEVAADNAQAKNAAKDWDYFFDCMEKIYAWEDWMHRRAAVAPTTDGAVLK